MITPVGALAFNAWAEAQLKKAAICRIDGRWLSKCPVCGDILYRSEKPTALRRAMEQHLTSYPPFCLEFLNYRPGDTVVLNGQTYVVHSGPHRPTVGRFAVERRHVFFLIVRRPPEAGLWRTSWKKVGELHRWRERR
jgi:hypothetical protein